MKTRRITTVLTLFTLFFCTIAYAQNNNPHGSWQGIIEIPGMNLNITVQFETADELISGTIDIPQQGASGLNLTDISFDGSEIRFAIADTPGNPVFNGVFEDVNRISGSFTQGGQTFPFNLSREIREKTELKRLDREEFLADLHELITDAMEYFNVPGTAVAIVQDGEVIFSEGFGYRNVEEELPVTPSTQFAIGSTTKAFTGFALSMLENDGILDWDEPLINYMPDFRMYDDFATQRMNAMDLLTHRSGLPRHDLAWYGSERTRDELFYSLRYLEPTADLRIRFQYQNLMYMAAGVLIERLTDMNWEDYTRQYIFGPLDMHNSTLSVTDIQRAADFSYPYEYKDDSYSRMNFRNIDAVGPAGSINSSVEDMSKWLLFLLNNGKVEDNTIVDKSVIDALFNPYLGISTSSGEPSFMSYGLGWFLESYRGHRLFQHAGGIDGFLTHVGLLPDANAGMVILTNNMNNAIGSMLLRHISSHLLELDPRDVRSQYMPEKKEDENETQPEPDSADTDQVKNTTPTLSLASYTGTYYHPGYGEMELTLNEETLQATINGWEVELSHWHFDVFRATSTVMPGVTFNFQFFMNVDGEISSLRVPLEPTASALEFERKKEDYLTSAEYMQRFTGTYELGPQTIHVQAAGNNLRVTITAQPPFTLEPLRKNLFQIRDMEGYRIRFEFEAAEKAQKIIFHQPNGTFEGTRRSD